MSTTTLQSRKKEIMIHDYDTRIDHTMMMIREELAPEDVALIERYDKEMVRASLSKPTRHKHLATILSLSRRLRKKWQDITKEDLEELVYGIMNYYSPDGKETNTTWDHKKVLKIFFRWFKAGSRDHKEVGDPMETKWIKIKRVTNKIVREQLITEDDLFKLLKICINPRDKAFFDVLYESGVRPSESLTLRVKNVNIEPSKELEEMRREISKRLEGFCKMQEHDYKDDFEFHATVAFKDINWKFGEIWKYLQKLDPPKIDQTLLRVTIIKNRVILCEYDLMLRRVLNRDQALDKWTWEGTMCGLEKRKELLPADFWNVSDSENDGKIFLISDIHFNHENIIRYCNRPFRNVEKMNQIIIDRWNSTVKNDDTVYFMGDLTLEKDKLDYWLGKLNGRIKFIRGNHDKGAITEATELPEKYPLVYKGNRFLLMHDPFRPANWDGWMIHGDKHNNNLEDFPFMNHEKKTINICSELVGYTPIPIDTIILNLSENKQKNYRYYEGEEEHNNTKHARNPKHNHRDGGREHKNKKHA